jgi:hypothetical protein
MAKQKNTKILVISDLHTPYQHPDAFEFLAACKKKFKFDKVVCIGDEIEHNALSFHDSNSDLPSAGDELLQAIEQLQVLYKLFPEVDVLESNHGSMAYRKAKHHGIPMKYIRDYNDVLEAPEGWVWHDELILPTPHGPVCFRHQFLKNPLIFSQQLAMNVCHGHFHSSFDIQYVSSPDKLMWAMTVSCLIDKRALSFEYNKIDLRRPILGVGVIIDGLPRLVPMVLNRKGRWNGKVV